jgi:uncharacterized protein (TIGR00255 family)
MIKSMTGFGRGSVQVQGSTLTLELRSVNGRYLEVHARFPREQSALEQAARNRVKDCARRGRVDLSMSLEPETGNRQYVNFELAASYAAALKELQQKLGISREMALSDVLLMPGVFNREGTQAAIPEEVLLSAFDRALGEALNAFVSARQVEGNLLDQAMRNQLRRIRDLLETIESACANLFDHYRTRLASRIAELLADSLVAQERIVAEAALAAERSDIHEEMVRMRSHLGQFDAALESTGEVGKQLDFLLQEMNREANTILSKAGPAQVSVAGVQLKSEIEKLREQVQNVE